MEELIAKNIGLVRLTDFELGTKCQWFYSMNRPRVKSVIIDGEPFGETPRIKINHCLPNGDIKDGGFVRLDELYKDISN